MAKLSVMAALILALIGLVILRAIFFEGKDSQKRVQKIGRDHGKDGKIKKVQSLIEQMEKENPELVKQIREQFIADARLKKAKNSDPEDVTNVVKYWLSEEENKNK